MRALSSLSFDDCPLCGNTAAAIRSATASHWGSSPTNLQQWEEGNRKARRDSSHDCDVIQTMDKFVAPSQPLLCPDINPNLEESRVPCPAVSRSVTDVRAGFSVSPAVTLIYWSALKGWGVSQGAQWFSMREVAHGFL